MRDLIKLLVKIYRLYHFYLSPTRMVIRRIAKVFFFEKEPCSKVLEIGGGNAMMREVLETACRPRQFISSDIDPSDKTDVVCDAQSAPFFNGVFDLIVAFEVMEHVSDTDRFLSEASRVAKDGGYVLMSMPFIYGKHDYQDFYRWTSQGLERIFNKHNMKILLIQQCGGTFLSIITLIINYAYQSFSGPSASWRSRSYGKKLYFGMMTVLLFPLMILSWLAYLLDLLIDRDSANPSGFVLVAQKFLRSEQ